MHSFALATDPSMDITGLILGGTKTVVQLSGVVSRHVNSYSTLSSRVESVQSKESRTCLIAERIHQLMGFPEISIDLLNHTKQDLEDIQAKLLTLDQLLPKLNSTTIILNEPVLARSLDDVDTKLTIIDLHLCCIGIQNSLFTAENKETRELASSMSMATLSISNTLEQQQNSFSRLESRLRNIESRLLTCRFKEERAEDYFAMGLAAFNPCVGIIDPHRVEPEEAQRAVRYCRMACDLGKKEAHRYLGDIYYHGYGIQRCFKTAVNIYGEGVARDDTGSKYKLTECYKFGNRVQVCRASTIRLLTRAVAEGCGESMVSLGISKLRGWYVPVNFAEAVRLFKRAMKKNISSAKCAFAYCIYTGVEVEYNPIESFRLLKESYDEGSWFSVIDMAHYYENGIGVEKNHEEATKLFEAEIRAGSWLGESDKALYGLRLVQGLGIEKDEALGRAIIIDATKKENSISWYVLGQCYRYGFGWKVNKARAKYFYEKALSCNSNSWAVRLSWEELGIMFEVGDCVTVDIRKASKYY